MKASLYVHIPFCRQKCDYCGFFSMPESAYKQSEGEVFKEYVSSVVNEVRFYARFYDVKEWTSIYLGGGTPGILSEGDLFFLITALKDTARLVPDCEITVEVNPENVTEKKIEALKHSGVNRLSMGVQALDDASLSTVNRKCSVEKITKALRTIEENWNGRFTVDFIAGLPGQTRASFEGQFNILDEFTKIDHVSLYTLTIEENTPLDRRIKNKEVKFDCDKADDMWIRGRNILEKKGFMQYEVSNFAKPGFESKHNSSYWKQKNYIGCGAGAVGTVYDFESKTAERWTNTFSVRNYIDFWNGFSAEPGRAEPSFLPRDIEMLDEETLEFEFLMTGFRLLSGVSSSEYKRRFGKSLEERLGVNEGIFADWKRRRLAKVSKNGEDICFSLTRRGLLLLNRFLEELL